VVVHLNSFGEGESFNGRYIVPRTDIDIVPSVERQAAISKVKADVSKGSSVRQLNALEKQLVQYLEPESDAMHL
jgi:hypothetical protein